MFVCVYIYIKTKTIFFKKSLIINKMKTQICLTHNCVHQSHCAAESPLALLPWAALDHRCHLASSLPTSWMICARKMPVTLSWCLLSSPSRPHQKPSICVLKKSCMKWSHETVLGDTFSVCLFNLQIWSY